MFSFLSAAFLWALPLAVVPVVIHLLNRRRRHVVRWGAMQFLLEAVSRRKRLWRWDDWLLMLLRAAAVTAMVLALARPLVRSSWFGSAGGRDVILVLDTSLSTSRTNAAAGGASKDGSLFEAMLRRVDDILGQLGGNDDVRVLLASTAPRWLTPDPLPASAENVGRLKARFRQLRPSLASVDMPRCVQEAARAGAGSVGSRRVVTVLTDRQAYGWRVGAGQAWRAVKQELEAGNPPAVLNVVSVGDDASAVTNLSVESLAASRSIAGVGEPVALTALVRNTGKWPTEASSITWRAGEGSLGATSLAALKPGESATVSLACSFDSPGERRITCRVDRPDDLPLDSSDRLIVEVVQKVPVLVIDDSPHADPLATETGYLLAALGRAPAGVQEEWHSVFEPKVVDAAAAASERLEDYQAVVCVDVARLTDEFVQRLEAYVRHGGGLWWVLGERSDTAFFNDKLFAQSKGLCPLPLGEPVGEAGNQEQYVSIHPPAQEHPATRLLADTQRLDMDRGKIYRRHRFKTDAASKVSVLLKTDQGEPVAVENRVGRGRAIVQTVPMNVRWSDVPLRQAFVVMVHEWLWYLVEPAFVQWNLEPGQVLTATWPFEAPSPPAAEVVTPAGVTEPVPVVADRGRVSCRFTDTLLAGDYTLRLGDARSVARSLPFQVRRDVRESDLAPLSVTDTQVLAMAAGVRFVNDPLADTPQRKRTPKVEPIWTWLLVAILVFMFVELVLAGWMTRRRWVRAEPVAMGEAYVARPTAAGATRKRERIVAG